MIKKNKLTKTERLEIELFLNKKYSMRMIAKMLGRSPNSISYEVKHNAMKNGYYDGKKADAKARLKKRMAKYQGRFFLAKYELRKINAEPRKIDSDFVLQKYIIEKLKEGLSPKKVHCWTFFPFACEFSLFHSGCSMKQENRGGNIRADEKG